MIVKRRRNDQGGVFMQFEYTQELIEYMEQKKQKNIIVEVVSCENSDIEITELYVHLLFA